MEKRIEETASGKEYEITLSDAAILAENETSEDHGWIFDTTEEVNKADVRIRLVIPLWMRSISGIVEVFGGENNAYPFMANGGVRVAVQRALVRAMMVGEKTVDEIQETLDSYQPEFGSTGQLQSWKPSAEIKTKQQLDRTVDKMDNTNKLELIKMIAEKMGLTIEEALKLANSGTAAIS